MVEFLDMSLVVAGEVVEIGGGLDDGEGNGVAVGVNEVGLGGWWRSCQISGEREEVLEGEGEGVFEVGEKGGGGGGGGVREVVEEEWLGGSEEKPRYVKEGER